LNRSEANRRPQQDDRETYRDGWTVEHYEKERYDALEAERKFMGMGEYAWAEDWRNHAHKLKSIIDTYYRLIKKGNRGGAVNSLRNLKHDPMLRPKNLSDDVIKGKIVQRQYKNKVKNPKFQGYTF